jgi:uncharacterized membrane protein
MELSPPILVSLLFGVIYLITGWISLRYPPKKINDFYGYRTLRSKKSQTHWDFAQKKASKHLIQAGYYCLLGSVPFILFDFGEHAIWIVILIGTILPCIALIQIEKALKEKFKD